MAISNDPALLAQLQAELAALRKAKLSFWENGGVVEYTIEDRTARYTSYKDMQSAERQLCSDIASLQRGGGNLVRFRVC